MLGLRNYAPALVCLAALLGAPLASAQSIEDTPILIPGNPVAGQPVFVEVHPTSCVLYLNDTPPLITRNGNAITMLQDAYVSPDPDFCIYPSGSLDLPLGTFSAGTYIVQIDVRYETLLSGQVTQTIGILPLTVSAPESIPILNVGTLIVLIVMLLLYGLRVQSRRRHCR